MKAKTQKRKNGKRHILIFLICGSLLPRFLFSERVGKPFFRDKGDISIQKDLSSGDLSIVERFFNRQIERGSLVATQVQEEAANSMRHIRYQQYDQGIPVFGGEVIRHEKDGLATGFSGEFYTIADLKIDPRISEAEAALIMKNDLNEPNLLVVDQKTAMFVFPINDREFRLAYRLVLKKEFGFSMTGLVDAETGEVLLKYSNIKSDLPMGKGTGQHGDVYKLTTSFANGTYYLRDPGLIRPVTQETYDCHGSVVGNLSSSASNVWSRDNVVNIHAYLGLAYDYFFLNFDLKGFDNHNRTITGVAHLFFPLAGYTDNAFWDGEEFVFCDPLYTDWHTGAAIDVVGHEYSHAITEYHANLVYHNESGALNETFSDVMSTAIEFFWQPEGSGFNMADWVEGEDIFPAYGVSNYLRNLADPNAPNYSGRSYPCHLSQKAIQPDTSQGDWGGVHVNSTIYSHAYYLLAKGGSNRVSGMSVTGIGIDKATQIFFRAWIHYMTSTTDFSAAADAIAHSARDLFGLTSSECLQTIQALRAIGNTLL